MRPSRRWKLPRQLRALWPTRRPCGSWRTGSLPCRSSLQPAQSAWLPQSLPLRASFSPLEKRSIAFAGAGGQGHCPAGAARSQHRAPGCLRACPCVRLSLLLKREALHLRELQDGVIALQEQLAASTERLAASELALACVPPLYPALNQLVLSQMGTSIWQYQTTSLNCRSSLLPAQSAGLGFLPRIHLRLQFCEHQLSQGHCGLVATQEQIKASEQCLVPCCQV